MKVVCAYCKEVISSIGSERPTDKISHGACDRCFKIELEKIKRFKESRKRASY